MSTKTVICVGAHPDDIELGCAGTIKLFIDKGYAVKCVYCTKGGYTGSPFERERESRQACTLLGVHDDDIIFGDFPDTRIPDNMDTIKFLQDTYIRRSGEQYELYVDLYAVFVPTEHDVHQDHRAVAYSSATAFRRAPRIYAYESPSSTGSFNPRAFVDISDYRQLKHDALHCHHSQLQLGSRYYLEYESILNLARFRGRQGGYEYAEAFEVCKESIEPADVRA